MYAPVTFAFWRVRRQVFCRGSLQTGEQYFQEGVGKRYTTPTHPPHLFDFHNFENIYEQRTQKTQKKFACLRNLTLVLFTLTRFDRCCSLSSPKLELEEDDSRWCLCKLPLEDPLFEGDKSPSCWVTGLSLRALMHF